MSGILDFQQYLGGPDQIKCEQVFPSDQKTYLYNFGRDISAWTFTVEYQTIVVDQLTFNRNTGKPNFAASTVIGSFPVGAIDGDFTPTFVDSAAGTLKVYIPAGLYAGAIIPDARSNVPIVVVSVTWADDSTPSQITTHRWAFVQCWEPGTAVGDPTKENDYTALTVGV